MTRSPIDSMPTTWPRVATGRCRKRFSVMSRMHVSMLSSGVTVTTGALMICHAGVSLDERPNNTTLRA